jgi:hypothetical protein
MASSHYIGMAGLHGCLPQYSVACDSTGDCADALQQVTEMGQRRRQRLWDDLYVELNPDYHGGHQYAEIVGPCDCAAPDSHNS